jgi:uncharacterized membrane-anchored protein
MTRRDFTAAAGGNMTARTTQCRVAVLLIGMFLGWMVPASADEPAQPPEESLTAAQQQARSAWQAAAAAMVAGPTQVTLRDQAKLDLPAGFAFIPKKESAALMQAMGNRTGDEFIGLIFPQADDKSWMVSVDYEDSGYIKDDDAKDWDADELLKSLRDGTEAANEERTKIGVPPIQVTRWIEKPAYEAGVHHLVWSAEVKLRDGEDPDPTINYNTYVLGREGYISMNLITPASTINVDKPVAKRLLASVTFNDGKRYSDFNSSTDKVAAYGLAALVAGVAAKKLGLLALTGVFIVKFAKLFAIGAAAVGGGVWKWLKGRSGKDSSGTPA